MKRLYCLVVIFLIFLASTGAWATEYHFKTTGNDTTGDGSDGNPYKSPLKAHQIAHAGDIMTFHDGTYTITSPISTVSQGYNGTGTGFTATNPVIFRANPGDTVTWTSAIADTVIKIGKNYHQYKGIHFVHAPATDTSGEEGFFRTGYEETSIAPRWENCTFTMSKRGDNYGSIHIKDSSGYGCTYPQVYGCTFTHTSTSGSTNTAGIIMFGVEKFKIQKSELSGMPIGLYLKHANSTAQANVDALIEDVFIKNCTRYSIMSNFNWVHWNHVIAGPVAGSDKSVLFGEANGGAGGSDNTLTHVTFMGGFTLSMDATQVLRTNIQDSIICARANSSTSSALYIDPYNSATDNTITNYNLYKPGTNSYTIKKGSTSYTFPNWRIYRSTADVNSQAGSPTFVGGSAPSTIAGYALTAESAGYQDASDGTNMGADVTRVGVAGETPATTPPVAGFSVSATSGTTSTQFDFTDSSTNTPTSWSWNFGDGTTSTDQNPQNKQYSAPGVYTVTLIATNAGGSDTETKVDYITVTPAPAPTANFNTSIVYGICPAFVQFTDMSTNVPTSWLWNFGDGTTSTDQHPTHTYTTPGNYTVSLTATNATGSDTKNDTVISIRAQISVNRF